jgi:ribonuclease HI
LPDALAGRSGSLPLETRILIGKWNSNSIAVDAAWNPVSKHIEYQGVNLKTGAVVFHKGPFAGATGNIGEFLAIVHGLAYLKQQQSDWPIYSDSRTAIAWVKARRTNSGLALNSRNQVVFDLVKRAESWLAQNDYENKVLKWETGAWGENPADFGR